MKIKARENYRSSLGPLHLVTFSNRHSVDEAEIYLCQSKMLIKNPTEVLT